MVETPKITSPNAQKVRKKVYSPNHLMWELFTLFLYYVPGVMGITLVLVFLVQFPLEPKADPALTPLGIAPEWYFLAMFWLLKKMPLLIAIATIVLYLMMVMFLPFLDFSKVKRGQSLPMKIIGWINIIVVIYLTFLGGHWLEIYIYPLLKIKAGH